LFFGHLDGEEQAAGVLGVDDASAKASPRSCSGGWARGQLAVQVIGRVRGFFLAKAQHFDANGGDACGCHNSLEDAVAVTLALLGLQVKTLDLRSRRRRRMRRYPVWGVVVELRSLLVSLRSLRWQVLHFLYFLFIFDLICKRFSSSSCIGSAVYRGGTRGILVYLSEYPRFNGKGNVYFKSTSSSRLDTSPLGYYSLSAHSP
jgi:hypothetical protein